MDGESPGVTANNNAIKWRVEQNGKEKLKKIKIDQTLDTVRCLYIFTLYNNNFTLELSPRVIWNLKLIKTD